jgi:salicylate hydroxylase
LPRVLTNSAAQPRLGRVADLGTSCWRGSLSAGKDLNLVLSHHRPDYVEDVQEVDMNELRDFYKDYNPIIKKVIDLVPSSLRWPLMVTGLLESWSSPAKNVVLMGDAAHSMVNHMAQGAATSMEDGPFWVAPFPRLFEA